MKADMEFGEQMERLVQAELLPHLFPLCDIKHVGKDKYWRRHGVDFVLLDALHEDRVFLDVKADKWDTGNIIAEDYTLLTTGIKSEGWLHTSKSDYILYVILPRRKYILIDLAKLRHLMQHRQFDQRSTPNAWGTTYFFLLPLAWLETEFQAEHVPKDTWDSWLKLYSKPPGEHGKE